MWLAAVCTGGSLPPKQPPLSIRRVRYSARSARPWKEKGGKSRKSGLIGGFLEATAVCRRFVIRPKATPFTIPVSASPHSQLTDRPNATTSLVCRTSAALHPAGAATSAPPGSHLERVKRYYFSYPYRVPRRLVSLVTRTRKVRERVATFYARLNAGLTPARGLLFFSRPSRLLFLFRTKKRDYL